MTDPTQTTHSRWLIWSVVAYGPVAMLVWLMLLVFVPATQPSVPAFAITGILLMFAMIAVAIAMERRRRRMAQSRQQNPYGKPSPDDQLDPNWNTADWYRDGELRRQQKKVS